MVSSDRTNMSESIHELDEVLKLSINGLEKEKDEHDRAVALLEQSLHLYDTCVVPSIVHIGCDLWVDMTPAEAKAYLNRRLCARKTALMQITDKIDRSNAMVDNLRCLQKQLAERPEGTTEEGLPIIEIQETLDEDGVVVGATLNDKAVDFETGVVAPDKRDSSAQQQASCVGKDKHKEDDKTESNSAGQKMETDSEDQIQELLADMEIVEKLPHPAVPTEGGSRSEDVSVKLPAIRPEDVYELELIASELADSDEDYVEDFDYDIEDCGDHGEKCGDEDEDGDDDDDSKADELLYGGNFGMFAGKAQLQSRLWDKVQALRSKKILEPKPTAKLKLVRFNEITEIKEVEDVSESLKKIEHTKQTLLRFHKRMGSGKAVRTERLKTDFDDVTRDIIDRSGEKERPVEIWKSEVKER